MDVCAREDAHERVAHLIISKQLSAQSPAAQSPHPTLRGRAYLVKPDREQSASKNHKVNRISIGGWMFYALERVNCITRNAMVSKTGGELQ
jgi:hypothetical protein